MSNLSKRCPLQDLPLDQFLINNSTTRIASKRPLSPTSASIFSPAKRRILNDEGLLSPSSPSSSSTPRTKTSSASWLSSSPGRKLEFRLGMDDPETLDQSHDKTTEPSATREDRYSASHPSISSPLRTITKLAPSPEFVHRPQHAIRTIPPTLSTSLLPSPPFTESCPSSDRYSVHYPGFVIFHDPVLPAVMQSREPDWMDDTESSKENVTEAVDHRTTKTRKLSASRNMFMSPGESTKEIDISWHRTSAGKAGPPAVHIRAPSDTDMQIV